MYEFYVCNLLHPNSILTLKVFPASERKANLKIENTQSSLSKI